jgi:biofilm PGA synthesis N-glycosyltransferase PgaC
MIYFCALMNWYAVLDYSLYVLIACAVVQVFYYLFFFIRLSFYKSPQNTGTKEDPVTIILCARNELENLEKNLPLLLQQDYPRFEVIVANDNSWDGTSEYLAGLSLTYPNLREVKYVENERYPKGKKFILTLAIKASKYELLLLTDADCEPASNQWIRQMQRHFRPETHIVTGYSPYRYRSGMLNRLVRFETFQTALQYLSFALAGMPYMGVGRNLSYRKSLFFAYKGFASHNHILSGDDDLFVNETANATNTKIEIDRSSFMYTEAEKTWSAWWQQKSRHLYTGKFYKPGIRRVLGIFSITHILVYVLVVPLLIYEPTRLAALIVFSIRLVIQYSVYGPAMKKLNAFSLWWALAVFDLLYAVYYFLIGIKTLFIRNKKW